MNPSPHIFTVTAENFETDVIAASDWNSQPNRALITQLLKDAGA